MGTSLSLPASTIEHFFSWTLLSGLSLFLLYQLTFSLHNFNTNIFKPYTKTQSLRSQQITSNLTSKRKSLQAQISPNCLSSPVGVCACTNLLNQLAFFPQVSCNSASLPFCKIYLWLFSKPHSFKNVPFITLPLPLSPPSMYKLFMSLPSIKKILHWPHVMVIHHSVLKSSLHPHLLQVRPREADLCRLHHSHAFESWILIFFVQ